MDSRNYCGYSMVRYVFSMDSTPYQFLVHHDGLGHYSYHSCYLFLSRMVQGHQVYTYPNRLRTWHRRRTMVCILDRRQGVAMDVLFCPASGRHDLWHEDWHITYCNRHITDMYNRTSRGDFLARIRATPIIAKVECQYWVCYHTGSLYHYTYMVNELYAGYGRIGSRGMLGTSL